MINRVSKKKKKDNSILLEREISLAEGAGGKTHGAFILRRRWRLNRLTTTWSPRPLRMIALLVNPIIFLTRRKKYRRARQRMKVKPLRCVSILARRRPAGEIQLNFASSNEAVQLNLAPLKDFLSNRQKYVEPPRPHRRRYQWLLRNELSLLKVARLIMLMRRAFIISPPTHANSSAFLSSKLFVPLVYRAPD